jgi:hypothetical protein
LDVAANSTHHDEFVVAFSTLQQRRKFLMDEISRVESEAEYANEIKIFSLSIFAPLLTVVLFRFPLAIV